VKSYKNSLP